MISNTVLSTAQETHSNKNLILDPSTNCHIRYYYYPNLEAYFDRETEKYIFRDKGQWKSESQIPSGYRGYGLFNKANIAINDYDEDNITQFLDDHRKKYPYNSLRKLKTNSTASLD
ncbi:hypothetical protein [Flavobacterium selenitireducens]|uniref:hypothetical protein n=1 Tax=Flavobacterium selenitireducens TaxID=2722704 RepID=UPI00168B2AB5|nr:hypothetical protein [Flavobacterium selenitireducens]MBD3581107.1 hypothetical protein [Flavobacterium selenitireducens]